MIEIPSEIKRLYLSDSVYKNIRIVFASGKFPDICNDKIVKDSVTFTESICSQNELRLGLYELPTFECKVALTQDFAGEAIVVYNEIDCTSLGDEWCAQNAIYLEDLDRFVYLMQIGFFEIITSQLENDRFTNIEAVGIDQRGQIVINDFFTRMMVNNYMVLEARSQGSQESRVELAGSPTAFTYNDLFGLNIRNSIGRWRGLSKLNFNQDVQSISLSDGYSLLINYDYYRTDPDINYNNTVTPDYSKTGTGTYKNQLTRYNAIIDFDKSERNLDFDNFVNSIKTLLPSAVITRLNSILSQDFVDRVKNPRYCYNSYLAYTYYTFPSSNPSAISNKHDGSVDFSNAYFDELLPGNGYDYYIYNFNRKTRATNLVDHDFNYRFVSGWVSRNSTGAGQILYRDRTLIIPTSINIMKNESSIAELVFNYKKKEIYTIRPQLVNLGLNRLYVQQDTLENSRYANVYRNYRDFSEMIGPAYDSMEELLGNLVRYTRSGGSEIVENFSAEELYPSINIYPSETLFPIDFVGESYDAANYISLKYEQTGYNRYGRVSVNYTDKSGTARFAYLDLYSDYDENTSKYLEYVLDNNELIKTIKYTQSDIMAYLNNIANTLRQMTYIPVELNMVGIPWIQPGDPIKIVTPSGKEFTTIIMSRTLTGEQHLVDNLYSDT